MQINEDGSPNGFSLSRRQLCGYGIGTLAMASALIRPYALSAAATYPLPVVDTVYGKVRGTMRNDVAVFKGMRYGASTANENRFLPPRKPAPWSGVFDAVKSGNISPQVQVDVGYFGDTNLQSEDCLFLDVWSPSFRRGKEPLPVMAWFHGGAFENGSGSAPSYDGYNLSVTGDVVVVCINHRLNIFGYSYLGDKDKQFSTSGNVGQLDLVAALEWIRDNIAKFGGDPNNVTIFGESGGGAKVTATVASPQARGLFHKAIVQSGSFLKVAEPNEAYDITKKVYSYLKINEGDVASLQRVPMARLLEAYEYVNASDDGKRVLRYQPVRDGIVLPNHPWSPGAPAAVRGVPMMIGTTAEETASMVSSEDLRAMYDNDEAIALKVIKASSFLAGDLSLDRVTAVVKEYRRLMPELDGVGLMVRIATDTGFWRGAVQQAERNVNAGSAPVYTYELDWPIPILGRPWAAHGVDISLMFGNPAYGSNVLAEGDNDLERRLLYSASEEAALAQKMMKAWAAFAHKGNPSTADAEWPAYNLQNRPTMVFGRNSRVVNDVRGSIRPLVMHLPGI